tara:strand:+ start:1284 stop:1907 length:624 start_codon:yes stop_codon:yes gene_type:complete
MKFLILFCLFYFVKTFNIAIVGASSNLGKEIIYQGIRDKNLNILGFTSKSKITLPYRGDTFNNKIIMPEFKNSNLTLENYWKNIQDYKYTHLIFCTSAGPFQKDYSDILIEKFLDNIPKSCKSISLVSAFGVGDSLNEGNIGIEIMNNFYLKDVYRAKNKQEKLLKKLDLDIKKIIYRPRALSYGYTNLNSMSRYKFAKIILDDLEL